MYKYFFRTIAVAAVYLTIHFFVSLYLPSPIAAEYWVRELIVVKDALATSSLSPRIVVLGGSSVLFGIDARQVTDKTGVFTMNMGLHAGLPIHRFLSIGEKMARRGDIFVLALEHVFYSCDALLWSDWQVTNMLAWDRPYFNSLSFGSQLNAIFSGGGPELSINILSQKIGSGLVPRIYTDRFKALDAADVIVARYKTNEFRTDQLWYSAYNLDDQGDMLNTAGTAYFGPGVPATIPGAVCPKIAAILLSFVDSLTQKGARVFAAHPPYLVDGAPQPGWQESTGTFAREMEAIGIQVIDRRDELFFPLTSFLNSNLHLNEIGRRERTRILINDLGKLGIGDTAVRR